MRMRNNQRGITFIGFIMMMVVVGFFAYAAMKLIPPYTEYFGVVKSMKNIQAEANIETQTIDYIRSRMNTQFSMQYVDDASVPPKSMTLLTQGGERKLRVAYDKDIPFIYNVDLLVHFDHVVDLTHGATY